MPPFDKDLFKIKSGKKIILRLTNIGSQAGKPMSHNVVILNKGTDMCKFCRRCSGNLKKSRIYLPHLLLQLLLIPNRLLPENQMK